jgi:predicted porin
MKKTIIAAAVAAAVAAPAAFADVKISGLVHMSVTDVNTSTLANASDVNDNVSRIVFSGSEDLGNGMKAGFKIEDRINMDTGDAATDDGRETYAELAGNFGSLKFGRMYGPTKRVFSMAEQAGDTAIDISTLSGSNELTNDGTVYYTSPNMSGLTLTAAFSGDGTSDAEIGDNTDISLTYSANGLSVGVASYSDDVTGTNDQTAVAVKYSAGDFTVAVSQQDTDTTTATNTKTATAASVSMKAGANTIIAQFGEKETYAGTQTDGWGLAVVHSMSKQTAVYAGVRDSDVAGDTDTAVALGFKHSF